MAKLIDEAPFCPQIPEDAATGEKIRILCDALMRVYAELRFQLSSLGVENFRAEGLIALKTALATPEYWSAIPAGTVVPPGAVVVYGGALWRCVGEWRHDPEESPEDNACFEQAG